MNRIIKLLISIVYWSVQKIFRGCAYILQIPVKAQCEILLYHAVEKTQAQQFQKQMDWVLQKGNVISIDHVVTSELSGPSTAITFDDAFFCIAEHALPYLEEKNIPATLFAPSAWLGKVQGWQAESYDSTIHHQLMSAQDLQRLNTDLFTIASHGVAHLNLRKLDSEQATYEMQESKGELEKLGRNTIDYFAFPYGGYRPEQLQTAMVLGYKKTFSAWPVSKHEGVMSRIEVSANDWPIEFKLKLAGAYQWLAVAIPITHFLKRFKK